MIIAVDFDGTLCEKQWPEIGKPNRLLIDKLIRLKLKGSQVILWTCRDGQLKQNAIDWCKNQGLIFDAVNDNVKDFGHGYKKIVADIYIDDKAIKPEDFLNKEFE